MEALLGLVEFERTHRECCADATMKEQGDAVRKVNSHLQENKDVKVRNLTNNLS